MLFNPESVFTFILFTELSNLINTLFLTCMVLVRKNLNIKTVWPYPREKK